MAAKRRATSPPFKRDLDALSEEEQKEELGKYIKSWPEDFLKWLLNEIQEELKSRVTKSELGAQMEGIHLRENSEEVENLKPEKEEKPLCASLSGEMEITDKAEDTHIEDVEGREEKEEEMGMKVQEHQDLEEGKAEQDQCIKEDVQHSCGEEAMEEDQIEKLQHEVNQEKEMDASMNVIEEGKILEKEVVQQTQVVEEKEMSTSIEEAAQENEETLHDGGEAQQEEVHMLPATLEVQEEEEPKNVHDKVKHFRQSLTEDERRELDEQTKQEGEEIKLKAKEEEREKAQLQKDEKSKAKKIREKSNDEFKEIIVFKKDYYKLFEARFPKWHSKQNRFTAGKAWVCDMERGIAHHITFNENGITKPGREPNGFFPAGYVKLVNARDVKHASGDAYYFGFSKSEGVVIKNDRGTHMEVNKDSFSEFYSQLIKSDRAFLVYSDGATVDILRFFRSNKVLIKDLLEQDIFLVDVSEAEKIKKGLKKVSDANLLERVKALRDIICKETDCQSKFNCLEYIVDVLQYYKVKEDY